MRVVLIVTVDDAPVESPEIVTRPKLLIDTVPPEVADPDQLYKLL